MAFDGAGTFTLAEAAFQTGTVINSTKMNNNLSDIASNGLSNCITKDGQTQPSANLPMNGNKHTGVLATSGEAARTEYVAAGALQNGAILDAGSTGGTSTAYTATLTPAITAYADKQLFRAKFNATTGADPTINYNSVGAKKMYAFTGAQISTGDIPSGLIPQMRYDSTLDSSAGAFQVLGVPAACIGGLALGQCYFEFTNSTTCTLVRHNGSRLFINGGFYTIPSAGVTLSNSGLSNSTLYYAYAYMNSGTMTLEASATAPAVDSTYGHKIKNGDATRSLVGAVYTTSGGEFKFSADLFGVCSWFNPKQISVGRSITANRTTTSATFVEINSELRVSWVSLHGYVEASFVGSFNSSTTTGGSTTAIALNSTTAEQSQRVNSQNGASSNNFVFPHSNALSIVVNDGLNYVTPLFRYYTASGTITCYADSASMSITYRG